MIFWIRVMFLEGRLGSICLGFIMDVWMYGCVDVWMYENVVVGADLFMAEMSTVKRRKKGWGGGFLGWRFEVENGRLRMGRMRTGGFCAWGRAEREEERRGDWICWLGMLMMLILLEAMRIFLLRAWGFEMFRYSMHVRFPFLIVEDNGIVDFEGSWSSVSHCAVFWFGGNDFSYI